MNTYESEDESTGLRGFFLSMFRIQLSHFNSKPRIMTILEVKLRAVQNARQKYKNAMENLCAKVEEILGEDGLIINDFPGDGLGIGWEDRDNYTPINMVINAHKERGELTKEDFEFTSL